MVFLWFSCGCIVLRGLEFITQDKASLASQNGTNQNKTKTKTTPGITRNFQQITRNFQLPEISKLPNNSKPKLTFIFR
jgi:hypothetical protein